MVYLGCAKKNQFDPAYRSHHLFMWKSRFFFVSEPAGAGWAREKAFIEVLCLLKHLAVIC